MKRAWMTSGLLAGTVLLSAGCVPEQKYNDLLTAYKGQEQQLLTAQNELSTARANEERLRAQVAATMADLEELQKRIANGDGDISAWIAKYEELKKQLESLEVTQLPKDLSDELIALANENPDVFEFDPRTGMLRFKNDFTFDSGSDQLKSGATAVLGRLATILNSPTASKFEVKVVGHTDNAPLVRTKAKFGTNVMLSVYRSASLRNALVKDGVSARRFQVAGYGEFRPMVVNGAKGAAENRRVELYLTPLAFDGPTDGTSEERTRAETPVATKAPATKAPAAAPAEDDEPTK
ncbi:MAG: OmpA family protein [Phycisphaerales bacterium]|jgi:flagellar motor protein MotB